MIVDASSIVAIFTRPQTELPRSRTAISELSPWFRWRVGMMVPLMVFHAHHPVTKLVTALPPGTDEMSRHSAPGGDGAVLTGLLVRNPTRSGR